MTDKLDPRNVEISIVYGAGIEQPVHGKTCSEEVIIKGETDERLKTRLERLEQALVFKGEVDYADNLPTDAEKGDTYRVANEGSLDGQEFSAGTNFYWNGEKWVALSGQYDATYLENKVKEAEDTAEDAKDVANNALEIANEALEQSGKAYYIVIEGEDLNEYSESGRYHAIDCTNAPTEAEFGYFVDVDINSDSNMVRQRAMLVDYTVPALDGTVWFRGNLAGDLSVHGNVVVDGDVSGNLRASGTITAGSVSGSITENASLSSYDIEEEGHGTTIYGDAEVIDGVFHTYYRFDTQATLVMNIPCVIDSPEYCVYLDTSLTLNADMTCTGASSSQTISGMYGTITVADGVTLTVTNNGTGYGVRLRGGGLVVNGEMYITTNKDEGIYITHDGTISGTGRIYVNGDTYYDGTNGINKLAVTADTEDTASEYVRWGSKDGDTVQWGEWKASGGGDSNPMLAVVGGTPNYYKRQSLFGSDKTTVTVYANTQVNIGNKGYISQVDTVLQLDDVATAANRAGKDVYVYAVQGTGSEPDFVLSLNSTVPDGYTADNSRKIGGFHCECNSVGTISGHTYSGLNTGDVIDISAWDLLHRANSENEGMVWIAGLGAWFDIYMTSYNGTQVASAYGEEICNGYSTEPFNGDKFVEQAGLVGKRLTTRDEFIVYAKGSNETTNIEGSASGVTAGGHSDTAGRRMISNYALEECCGHFWQWNKDQYGGFNGVAGSSYSASIGQYGGVNTSGEYYLQAFGWDRNNNPDGTSRVAQADVDGSTSLYGDSYGVVARFLSGGRWGHGVGCGSRSVLLDSLSARRESTCAGRCASEPRIVNF